MKKRRKGTVCLNCDQPLQKQENYCPQCGQENTTYHLSVGTLIRDFMQNYFNFESRLGRSIVPFLFQPGKLTQAFVAGQRRMYVHPIRFYLIISLLFFFLFSQITREDERGIRIKRVTASTAPLSLDSAERNTDTIVPARLSTSRDTMHLFGNRLVFSGEEMARWLEHDSTTAISLLDSARASRKTAFDVRLSEQVIRMYRDRGRAVNRQIIESIPTMLFLFLPLVAWIFKLLYVRRKFLYVEHLILAIHFHTFLFFLLGLFMLLAVATGWGWIYAPAVLTAIVYGFAMMRRFYGQSFGKTLLKCLLLSVTYVVMLVLFLAVETLVSILLF